MPSAHTILESDFMLTHLGNGGRNLSSKPRPETGNFTAQKQKRLASDARCLLLYCQDDGGKLMGGAALSAGFPALVA
jgi:hypothetical protein